MRLERSFHGTTVCDDTLFVNLICSKGFHCHYTKFYEKQLGVFFRIFNLDQLQIIILWLLGVQILVSRLVFLCIVTWF